MASDLVDLTALLNVLALLTDLDLGHLPGVRASLETVERAACWAGDDPARWRSVSPFYPEPDELARAATHAAECGVAGVAWLAPHVRRVAPRDPAGPHVVCSAPYGPPTWHSETLRTLRTPCGPRVARARPRGRGGSTGTTAGATVERSRTAREESRR